MNSRRAKLDCNDRDREALDRLSREFRLSLVRYFGRRIRDISDLEDMVQEVFERLIKRGKTSELARQNINAYVFETASSVLKDRLRKRLTHRADAHETFNLEHHAGTDYSPEDVLLNRERLQKVGTVLLELPQKTRDIFVLRRLEGMRIAEIASRLGVSVSTVEKHMHRAVLHLMRRIDKE